jgi:predicted RNA binding protein YcfA (HicA-like mRNA interferase family)
MSSKNKALTTVLDYKKSFRKTNDFLKYIEGLGYKLDRKGSHLVYIKSNCKPLFIPDHKDLSMGVCGSLAKIIMEDNR